MTRPGEMATAAILAELAEGWPPEHYGTPEHREAWEAARTRHRAFYDEAQRRPVVEVIGARCAVALGDRESVAVSLGCIGPRERFARITRTGPMLGNYRADLYGVTIAEVSPETVAIDAAGHFTMSTRAALGWLLGDPSPSLATPGSRGGKPGPASLTLHANGRSFVLREGDGPLTITNEETDR